ncbi:MAG: bifunctional phosphoribosylaminoimidazolecarboxamide formyltransferase/IMP cyclohydrolase, partial [Alphaproteobacteria bacterium]|nr:bifunctional phosphoribosylaminoimidazolecarboxamide formyltransferase/IMP cyclohydrolase [Alphaproteobacteria bacterium]
MSEETQITRALISVSDKTGLIEFAQGLAKHKVRILSTGGSAKMLRDAGIAVTDVSDHTGFPEIMDGRVKTLHPTIHGGILAVRDNPKHRVAMESHAIDQIDLVVVNLYPFVETVASGADYDTCIENIDIGGPAMIRAAAKNHKDVTIVTDPGEYQSVLKDMDNNSGATSIELRRFLAREAYARTSAYDAAITNWLAGEQGENWPKRIAVPGRRQMTLRYGENPHQEAALYRTSPARAGVTNAEQLQGKELSFNNLNDADAAFELVSEFEKPAIVIVKHANPCGVAQADSLIDAWKPALDCDPTSAFGGIVATNKEIEADLAKELTELFLEVVIAPSISEEAAEILSSKKNLRVLVTGTMPDPKDQSITWRTLSGGLLAQTRDNGVITREDCKVVTKREPTEQEWNDMLFAWKVAKHVKSNAIVYVRDESTVGIGAGQMSRIDSSKIAASKSEEFKGP